MAGRRVASLIASALLAAGLAATVGSTAKSGHGAAAAAETPVGPSASRARAPAPDRGVRLVPVSAEIVEACREAQREVAYTVLCPARLPRPTAAGAPAPLDVGVYEGGRTIDLGYGAAYEHPQIDALNTPARFLHFVVGKAIHGVPADARLATLGGRRGLLAPASGPYFQGAYYGNHVRFVWRERGTRYVATLHTFGNRVPERCSIGSCAP